jgi:hypothetical protein
MVMALAGSALADEEGGRWDRRERREDRRDHDRYDRDDRHDSRQEAQWVFLGQATMGGRRSSDTITVGRDAGRFTRLYLTASGEADIRAIQVTFANGDTVTLDGSGGSGRNESALTFDLPGRARAIDSIEVLGRGGRRYRGHYGRRGVHSVVQIWGELRSVYHR